MKRLKDTAQKGLKNIGMTGEGSVRFPNYHQVPDHDIFVESAYKAQNITTAVYMVTDLVPEDDPLVHTLRDTSVFIMNTLFSLTHASQVKKVEDLSQSVGKLSSLIAYLNVLQHNGKVSDMNHRLLETEILTLQEDLNVLVAKNMPYDRQRRPSRVVDEFSFTDDFFRTEQTEPQPLSPTMSSIKDMEDEVKDILVPKGKKQEMVTEKPSEKAPKVKKRTRSSKGHSKKKMVSNSQRNERHENILKILKQKRDASISDITSLITDCSQKTIQRDLNQLVSKGLVSREGDRRWSVYNLTY